MQSKLLKRGLDLCSPKFYSYVPTSQNFDTYISNVFISLVVYPSCVILLNFLIFALKDFGDYLEGYYSVQTPEGEQISQLIAGYIDIILKKVNTLNPDFPV